MILFNIQSQILFMLSRTFHHIFRFNFSSLCRSDAESRASLIKKNSIDYSSHLTLHKGAHYDGLTNITFEANQDTHSHHKLRVDFQGKQVKGLLVNQNVIPSPQTYYYDGAIHVPVEHLKRGTTNSIVIHYANDYDKDGNGCVSFIDVDAKQYLYTQFQPYFANRVFPLFDQPDLKATMALTISCPNDWDAVLSNQNVLETATRKFSVSSIAQRVISNYQSTFDHFVQDYESNMPNSYKITAFKPTTLLPSYLYCFVVGPYKELLINTKMQGKPGYIPMKLYSIESLYPQLQNLAPYIEEITVQSMQFFQKYFGYKYPFSKYDQVFAHEYKWGAMENAGIVTLNDLYLFKDKVSNQKLLSFGNTIVHELAHHWFGNLVTMKWWDDLWLNESFAEYISHFCLEKIKKNLQTISFESAMLSFFNRKAWGYAEDKLMTTHSIRSKVDDTFTAESIFDGITYSKGAATMKQLMYLLGQEQFSLALKQYFHKYQFSNAVLDDLLASLEIYFQKSNLGFSLAQWKQMWLETAGTNVLSCQWQAGKNKLVVHQGFDLHCSTLRLHRIKIALVQANHSIIPAEVLVLAQEKTEVNISIPAQTVAVLLNYEDLTFATIELDERSRNYFSQNLQRVNDVLSRALVWKAYYNMLIDSKITSREFIDFVLNNIQKESSDPIFEEEIGHLSLAVNLYTPQAYRETLNIAIYNNLKTILLGLDKAETNRSVILTDKLIDFASSNQKQDELVRWYNGQQCELSIQKLNNTLRWKIVLKIFGGKALNLPQKLALLEDMKSKDSSDTMINKKLACQALVADEQQLMQIYFKFFEKGGNLSLTNTVSQMRGFNHECHYDVIKSKFYDLYFKDSKRYLHQQASEEEKWFAKSDYLQNFIVHMDPIVEATVADLERKICDFKLLQPKNNDKIKRTILKKVDLLQRRVRIYKYFLQKESSLK